MKKKSLVMIIILLIIAAIILTGLSDENKDMDDGKVDYVPVMVTKLKLETIEDEFFSVSRLEPEKNILIQASIGGTVEEVFVKSGEKVKIGSPLFSIKEEDLKEKLELLVKESRTELDQQKIYLNNMEKSLEDSRRLLLEGAISKDDYKEVEQELDTIRLNFDLADKNYRTSIVTYENNLQKLIICSPSQGIVANINVKENELLQIESGVEIITENKFICKIAVPEELIDIISFDTCGQIYLPSQGKYYDAKVKEISQRMDYENLSYEVTLQIPDLAENLKDGMYSEVTLITEKIENQILIPEKSIMYDGDKSYIYMIEGDDHIKKIFVEKGIVIDDKVQINGNVESSDWIIIKGQHFVDENSKIKIVERVE